MINNRYPAADGSGSYASSYLDYNTVKVHTFSRDLVTIDRPYSPVDGNLASLGQWNCHKTYPCTSPAVPFVARSFSFSRNTSPALALPIYF